MVHLSMRGEGAVKTYSFLNGAKLLELLSESSLLGVPGKASTLCQKKKTPLSSSTTGGLKSQHTQ